MYNLVRAAEVGWQGEIAAARDFGLLWNSDPSLAVPAALGPGVTATIRRSSTVNGRRPIASRFFPAPRGLWSGLTPGNGYPPAGRARGDPTEHRQAVAVVVGVFQPADDRGGRADALGEHCWVSPPPHSAAGKSTGRLRPRHRNSYKQGLRLRGPRDVTLAEDVTASVVRRSFLPAMSALRHRMRSIIRQLCETGQGVRIRPSSGIGMEIDVAPTS